MLSDFFFFFLIVEMEVVLSPFCYHEKVYLNMKLNN